MRKIDPVKHDEKRHEILDAAEKSFLQGGFQGTSIAEICERAQISPGHLYHYFESKEAIIEAIADRNLEKAAVHFKTMMDGPNILTTMLAQIDKLKFPGHQFGNLLMLDMLAEARRNEAVCRIVQKQSKKLCRHLADLLRSGQARGHIEQSLDVDATVILLVCLMDGLKGLGIRDVKANRAECIDQYKLMLSRFLTPAVANRQKALSAVSAP